MITPNSKGLLQFVRKNWMKKGYKKNDSKLDKY